MSSKMKVKKLLIRSSLALLMITNLGWAEEPKNMKMYTDTPPGVATPDELKTSIGTLRSFDGVPDSKTTQLVYDNLDLQRATQAFLSTLQVASLYAMKEGLLEFGPANYTGLLFEDLMDSKALWLTPNTVSIYQVI